MNAGLIKVLGLATSAVGIGANLLSSWVDEKKMKKEIEEQVVKEVSKQMRRKS